jgi:ABC-type transport system substrate-binding protein
MIRHFLLAIFLISALAGCSGKKNGSEIGKSGDSKVFRYNQSEGLSSLDPAFARNQANIWAISQLYDGLFEFTRDLSEHPLLAETWDISEDKMVYTINIKKGIFFQDDPCFPGGKGRELTAEDFVYSFKRIVDPGTASTGSWIFNDKVILDASGKISDTAFVASQKYQIKIYLHEPFPPFLQILAMPYTYVVPKEAVEFYGKDFGRNPVGTGPFRLKDWDEGQSLVMLKNTNYWRTDPAGAPLPYLDAVQVSFIGDKNQELFSFQ